MKRHTKGVGIAGNIRRYLLINNNITSNVVHVMASIQRYLQSEEPIENPKPFNYLGGIAVCSSTAFIALHLLKCPNQNYCSRMQPLGTWQKRVDLILCCNYQYHLVPIVQLDSKTSTEAIGIHI
jgi:hypothetical protein